MGNAGATTAYSGPAEYSDWNNGTYSGCTMCHAAVANGRTILTNEQLAAYNYQMRQRGFDAARMIEPIDYLAQVLDCSNGCDTETTLWMMVPGLSGSTGKYVDDFAELSDQLTMPARNIRYTQDNIGAATQLAKNQMYLDDLIGSMATYGWSGRAINIVEVDGIYYSLDHRRLVAAQQLGMEIPVTILNLSDPAVLAEFTRKSSGLQAGTQGLFIDVRGTGIRFHIDGTITFHE